MANTSFYRLKFRTIDLMTDYSVGGHLLTWWQPLSSYLNKMSLLMSWTNSLHESSGHLYQLSNKTRMSSFGLLKLEIWAEHWIVSWMQDKFRLLFCSYNLNLKTTLLNLGLFMKVLGLCLSFPSI
jgi:hypothetical protein